jgi:tRNA threonylcarbamoyladenosine biosynthesis protein TsaE
MHFCAKGQRILQKYGGRTSVSIFGAAMYVPMFQTNHDRYRVAVPSKECYNDTMGNNLRLTKRLAKTLVKRMRQNGGGTVLFDAPMGTGKTTFISFAVKYLNRKIKPSSPTFSIINKYADNIYHADLYRLEDTPKDIGLYDLLVPNNYVFIEWAGNLDIPSAIHIKINVKENGTREFIID